MEIIMKESCIIMLNIVCDRHGFNVEILQADQTSAIGTQMLILLINVFNIGA